VAYALQQATLEVGDLHVEFATYLAADIEAGIDQYLSAVAPVAHLVIDNPTLVFVNSVPSCVHFDALLEDLRSPVKLHHQARQWALRSLPAPQGYTPKASLGAPAPGPSPQQTPTPLSGRRFPPGFAASHMPLDLNHKDKVPFCLKHVLGKPCDASKCKFSHGELPANAFNNAAFLALLKSGN
jgi:hypothetical protein